jgi:hypothetical protein
MARLHSESHNRNGIIVPGEHQRLLQQNLPTTDSCSAANIYHSTAPASKIGETIPAHTQGGLGPRPFRIATSARSGAPSPGPPRVNNHQARLNPTGAFRDIPEGVCGRGGTFRAIPVKCGLPITAAQRRSPCDWRLVATREWKVQCAWVMS